ncbi:hypothetical protein X772_22810 [Mesorhizobium sp. LSJC280B00]|nr:hypothetical protein X772_22810 [Mesorhizobium sp. LSJC280B00]
MLSRKKQDGAENGAAATLPNGRPNRVRASSLRA